MVELVDTLDSGSSGSNTVRVRVSLSPHSYVSRFIFDRKNVPFAFSERVRNTIIPINLKK